MASDKLLRWLCWSLIVFAVATAVMQLALIQNPFQTPIPDNTDLVARLEIIRADDTKAQYLLWLAALVAGIVYVIAAMLGPVLRRLAPRGGAADMMATVFIVGGIIGVGSQLAYIAVADFATHGICECLYKTEQLIAQDYALSMGWTIQFWLNTGALVIVGLAAALAGRVVDLSRDWRILSYLIAVGVLVGVALRLVGMFQASDILVGITAGIGVPIWAFLLARGSGKLAEGS